MAACILYPERHLYSRESMAYLDGFAKEKAKLECILEEGNESQYVALPLRP